MCELVDSGIRPCRLTLDPPMCSTMLVIGDTVVTILKSVSVVPDKWCVPGAQAANNVRNKIERDRVFNVATFLLVMI